MASVPSKGIGHQELYTPAEVAELFGVDPQTVNRWANAGRLNYIRTLGGHRRFFKQEVDQLRQSSSSK